MEIIWTVLKFIIANILLIVVTSTLIGNSIRGFIQPRVNTIHGGHKDEFYALNPQRGILYSTFFSIVSLIVLITVFYFINVFVFLGLLFWMVTRVKDLYKEIITGEITTQKNMTNSSTDIILTALSWIGFFIFNYGLYKFWF